MSRGYIYKLLGNPLYVGRIAHRGKTYEGQHPAIVDAGTWDAVQAALAANASDRSSGPRATEPSPLLGKLFDESGVAMTPSHAVKSGRRYRYYVSRDLVAGPDDPTNGGRREGWRLPAREIEQVVANGVRQLLEDRSALAAAVRHEDLAADHVPDVLDATTAWKGRALDLIDRVDLGPEEVAATVVIPSAKDGTETRVRHSLPIRIRKRGVERRIVLEGRSNAAVDRRVDPALVKAIARARKWFEDLASGRVASTGAIARAEGVSSRYVRHLMPLAFLSPEIVEAILDGTQPVELTAETLTKHTDIPLGWDDQKAVLALR